MKRKRDRMTVRSSEPTSNVNEQDVPMSDPVETFEHQGNHPSGQSPSDGRIFTLTNLPRELRDRIYDFHLEDTCEKSRLRDWAGYHWGINRGVDEEELKSIKPPTRPGFFYESVFIHHLQDETDTIYSMNKTYEAREHPIPVLTLLESSIAKEAWEYYANKLLVHADALNRFQTWCMETLDRAKYVGLRKLYVVTTAMYRPSTATLRSSFVDENHPAFLIQIIEAGKAITVSSRFQLAPDSLAILRANLNTLMAKVLRCKDKLNGEDLVEAMFAIHNHTRAKTHRRKLIIGTMRKGIVSWPFLVDDEELRRVSQYGKTESEILTEAVRCMKAFRHVLYRAGAGLA